MADCNPHHLLTGYALEVSPNFLENKIKVPNTIQSKEDIRRHSKHLQALMSRSWNIFLKEYVNKLNVYKKQVNPHRKLKIGDIVLYSGRGERIPINQYIVCRITQIFGNQRSLKVETIQDNIKKEFTRPTDQFCLLEINDDDMESESKQC